MRSEGDESAVEMVPAVQSHQDPDAPELADDAVSLIRSFQVRGPATQHRRHVLGLLRAPSLGGRGWLEKLQLFSPSRIFRHTVDEREEVSLSVSSPVDSRPRFGISFPGSINWSSVSAGFKEWIEHPRNAALLVWLICVSVSTAMQGLLLLGLLDEAFPTKASRNHWIEIDNQVLNALFTLMSLYQHPSLFHHLVLLCRWRPEDVTALRKIYCKDGAYRPHEWVHMLVVLLLLHITCFAQYISCGLYWGYTSEARPEFAEIFFFGLGFAAPVLAGAYAVYSPLGRECDAEPDEESQGGTNHEQSSVKPGIRIRKLRALVSDPKWAGGLFDCRDDITVSFLSCFCTFCVFGWNMERLGFGNMVQMRKRFRLPGNELCCGSKSLTDYLQWLFCWPCSLAQEVRTGNKYEVEDDSLYRKHLEEEEEDIHPFLQPLPRESGLNSLGKLQYDSSLLISYPAKSPPASTAAAMDESRSQEEDEPHDIKEAYLVLDFGGNMKPPSRQLILSKDPMNV
ncbi:Ras family [Musa troglodytarum]|uniref:Ras family n=1 Tax=Musa troglodytarum TaxID=320322 RepID=A0A9E7G982_9LILI|nr:Ras family [Musa troglodytarum]